jgi:radical SAM protein with 4Fe4S-binding SPASM domain
MPDASLKFVRAVLDDVERTCDILQAVPTMSIAGGDPILHPRFWEICEMVKSVTELKILGNPENLTPRNIGKLKDVGVDLYQVSLDGTRKTHDSFRYEGSFLRTTQAIQDLAKAGIKAVVMSTISAENYEQMFEVMRHSYENGAKMWAFARFVPPLGGDCGITPGRYGSFLKAMVEHHKEMEDKYGVPRIKKEPLIRCFWDDVSYPDSGEIIGGCGLGTASFSMNPDGTIMACRRLAGSELGRWSPEKNFLHYFLFDKKMKSYRELDKIEGCGDCNLRDRCRGCRAVAQASTGSVYGKDPQCFYRREEDEMERNSKVA